MPDRPSSPPPPSPDRDADLRAALSRGRTRWWKTRLMWAALVALLMLIEAAVLLSFW